MYIQQKIFATVEPAQTWQATDRVLLTLPVKLKQFFLSVTRNVSNTLCVSSEAAFVMRVGLSMGEEEQPSSASWRRSGCEVSIIVTDAKRNDASRQRRDHKC